MGYETRTVEWHLPTASYFFEAERDAGVRTAGLLARQSPQRLDAIRIAIENAMKRYAKGNECVLPMRAHRLVEAKPAAFQPFAFADRGVTQQIQARTGWPRE